MWVTELNVEPGETEYIQLFSSCRKNRYCVDLLLFNVCQQKENALVFLDANLFS